MDDNKDDSKPQTSSTETNGNNNFPQIALGCEDGFIYILKNYEIFRYAHVKRTVTKLETVKLSKVMDTDVDNNDSEDSVDSLLCSGHFNALLLYYRGQVRIIVVGNLAYFSTEKYPQLALWKTGYMRRAAPPVYSVYHNP